MTALDVKIVQNNDITLQFSVVDSSGTAVNITGATIKWTARSDKNSTAVISKTVGSGITITNGSGGVFQVALTAANTATLRGRYVHEAVVTISGSNVTLTNDDVTWGTLTIREQFTAQ